MWLNLKPRLYVAHTLGLMKYVEEEVFPELEEYFEIMDPFRDRRVDYEDKTEEEIREMIKVTQTPSWVVKHDLADIKSCDALLMINNGGPSYGSIFELAYAHRELGIPCVAVVQHRYLNHPWLKDYCITVTDNIETALLSFFRYYGIGDYKR